MAELNLAGHETQRLAASGMVAGGQEIILYSVNWLSGAIAGGVVTRYEAQDDADLAKRRGGLTGPGPSIWDYAVGFRQQMKECYVKLDSNVIEVIVGFRRR